MKCLSGIMRKFSTLYQIKKGQPRLFFFNARSAIHDRRSFHGISQFMPKAIHSCTKCISWCKPFHPLRLHPCRRVAFQIIDIKYKKRQKPLYRLILLPSPPDMLFAGAPDLIRHTFGLTPPPKKGRQIKNTLMMFPASNVLP